MRSLINEAGVRYAAKVALVAAVYYGGARLGLDLAFETRSVTAIWPPTGIALAALVLWGYRMWPGVAIGAFLANAWTGVPLVTVLGITTGNTLEALVGAYLLVRVAGFRPSLERVRDVLALVALAGAVSTAVSASIGVTSLLIGDEISADNLPSVWRTWWLGDMGGDLLVAPLLLVAATHWPFRRAPGRPLEAVGVAVALAGATVLVFSQETSLTYLVFPMLIWAALRFWQPGATVGGLIVAAIAVLFTADGEGPFAANPPDERLLLAQTFVGTAGITALLLAVVISERERVEEAAQYIADTLQESLRPVRLPSIPGVDTAARFRPAGERHEVGGDFYDVFSTADGSWALVVGDVCGKGADAAAVTGLARSALRTATIYETGPSRILAVLNETLLRQRADEEFCTATYARLDADGREGVEVTLSSGGHPLPLLVRAQGGVEVVGVPGMALGIVEEPELTERRLTLGEGDALVLYTDGLTDAYAPGRALTTADLITWLEGCAGLEAHEIVERLEQAVLGGDGAEPRDDIAILVLRVSR